MKKSLVTFFVVLAMLTVFVGTASAAPLASGVATLVSVEYVPTSGPVFTFSVNGEFSNTELKGSLHVQGGEDLDLYCTQVDSNTVRCTVSKKAAGKNVVLSWGGQTFWTSVPADPHLTCHDVYDWTPGMDGWMVYGGHCEPSAATYGDTFTWDNPEWGLSPYVFLPESPKCPFYVSGDAYYYPSCPNN